MNVLFLSKEGFGVFSHVSGLSVARSITGAGLSYRNEETTSHTPLRF